MPTGTTDDLERSQADRARLRLAREIATLPREIATLPRWGSPALWDRLRSHDPQTSASSGALVSYLRTAMRRRDTSAAREIFVLILGRMERLNREWALRAIARTPSLHAEAAATVREDLLQEVTLHLWSEMALGNDEAWEIFFTRALGFAQRHIATAFMERNGYWIAPGVRKPSHGIAIPFSRLAARYEPDERAGDEWPQLVAHGDGMVAAELADLRELVTRLPERQRAVVIMRYWQNAQERDIAARLGVTPRAVRAMLAGAYAKLRAAYEQSGKQ
jgi:RNA polymerase sigma factor (sigma-70 family)